MRWAMIISTILYGREQANSCVVRISGGALSSGGLMLALPRRQTVTMRVWRLIPTVRTAKRSEPLRVLVGEGGI